VLAIVQGVNPRFDKVARALIQRHQEEKAWTDIGLSILGVILFVAGLFVSLFGGPAGVVAFLTAAGTIVGGIQAIRSIDKAIFETAVSEASIIRGGGFISLESAANARFWAYIDTALAAVDIKLSVLKGAKGIIKARQAETAARAVLAFEAGEKVPFEELFRLASNKPNQIVLRPDEFRVLTSTNWNAVGDMGEQVARRIATWTQDFVFLGTKVKANQGIDLLMVRKAQFEKVFGPITDSRLAAGIMAAATDAQKKQLAQLLSQADAAEDLVSLEVKASRTGVDPEELLKAARGGVAYDTTWFTNLMTAMKGAKDPGVKASGELLEKVIGTQAQKIGRITRVAVRIAPDGSFVLSRLSDPLIDQAHRLGRLWRGRGYTRMQWGLIHATRKGDAAKMQQWRQALEARNTQISQLEAAIKAIKDVDTAAVAVKAQEALKRASDAAKEVAALQELGKAPAVLDALFVANATLKLNLEIAQQSIDEIDAADARHEATIKTLETEGANTEKATDELLDSWNQQVPGIKDDVNLDADREQLKKIRNGEAVPE
jgi:hypothetical protein